MVGKVVERLKDGWQVGCFVFDWLLVWLSVRWLVDWLLGSLVRTS